MSNSYEEQYESNSKKHFASAEQENDQQLWLMFLSGKDEAIASIYTKFLPVLYNYGRNLVNNEALVGDCIQDVFTDLIDKREKLSAATSVKFYLISCLRRKLLRQISRNKKLVSEDLSEQDGFIFGLDPEVVQLNSRYDTDEKKIIEQACNSLPKKQREAIMLYFFEQFSYPEIAAVFNFSHPKNARTLIYRALESLEKKLSNWKSELMMLLVLLLTQII